MLRRSRTKEVKERVARGAQFAAALGGDKKFRKELLAALRHGELARDRAARSIGLIAVGRRLASDEELRNQMAVAVENLRRAWARVERKRSRRRRNALLLAAGAGGVVVVALPHARRWIASRRWRGVVGSGTPHVIDETIELDVPVSTAYNQWTQFEDFPLFMEGVEHVQQVDDTRLHWAATVAGRRAEWDAKILEQHPDQQISWISEDGRQTRGTVSFEPLGDARALVRLSMSYRSEGVAEEVGSAAGLDTRRVRGDLQRFKELVESRGSESGAWRGEVTAGRKT
jgi:uncharacterized membrane protein